MILGTHDPNPQIQLESSFEFVGQRPGLKLPVISICDYGHNPLPLSCMGNHEKAQARG